MQEQRTEVGLCECGCGRRTELVRRDNPKRGMVKGRHRKFIHGHNRRQPERWEVRDCGYSTPCWIWLGAHTGRGYGAIRVGKATRQAHRVLYERIHGLVVEPHLDHLCRVKSCVNPDHLEPVTVAENTRRGLTAKITLDVAREIRARVERGDMQSHIARNLGVSPQLVCDIKKGRRWRDA